ncbi:MAG TPA: PilZ domain-containing protein, partial [Pyrinomonadaceae bacterium]|nr:PilZ domain-containing protein [Pyrinomonadaceae bacterium]
ARVPREEERAGVDTALYVLWLTEDKAPHSGKITNLSRGGCFVQSRAEVRAGSTVLLRLMTPTERWLRLQGEVAHATRRVGFGLRFTGLSREDRGMLALLQEYYRGEGVVVPTIVGPDELPPDAKRVRPL